MERQSFTNVDELDREILMLLEYRTLANVRLVSKTLFGRIDNVFWYKKLEQLLGVKIAPLQHQRPRIAYQALENTQNDYRRADWIVLHRESALFLTIRPSLNIRKSQWVELFETTLDNNDPTTRRLIEKPWIYRECRKIETAAIHNNDIELLDNLLTHSTIHPSHLAELVIKSARYNRWSLFDRLALLLPPVFSVYQQILSFDINPTQFIESVLKIDDQNRTNELVLNAICSTGRLDVLSTFIDIATKQQVSLRRYYHRGVIHATESNQLKIIKYLFGICGQSLIKEGDYKVFRVAVDKNNVSLARWLLNNYKIDINAARGSALRRAVRLGNIEMVNLLLAHAADYSLRNYDALFIASARGNYKIAKGFLENDYYRPNRYSVLRPVQAAIANGHDHIVRKFFERFGVEHYLLQSPQFDRIMRTARRTNNQSMQEWLSRRLKDLK